MITEDRIIPVKIEEEMRTSYIDYSMSVIVSRALPDVRDGFKPVHRRVLYAMWDMGNTSDKPTKKSAALLLVCRKVIFLPLKEVIIQKKPEQKNYQFGILRHK